MPELPEVETLRRDLEREVVGKKVKSAEAPEASAYQAHGNRKAFVQQLDGAKITGVGRRGLWLLLSLDTGAVVGLHLGEAGHLLRATPKDPVAKGTQLVLTFTQGGQLRVVDRSKGAQLLVVPAEQLEEALPELAELGLDPVDEPISWVDFGRTLLARSGKLKALLMDPTFVVGLGPLYSDEVLFHAGLRYDREPSSLSSQEIRRLYRALVETVHEAVKHRGTTLGDDGFTDLKGQAGGYGELLAVHGREGEMSPRARGPIVRAKFAGGWTYYCEQTQV